MKLQMWKLLVKLSVRAKTFIKNHGFTEKIRMVSDRYPVWIMKNHVKTWQYFQ